MSDSPDVLTRGAWQAGVVQRWVEAPPVFTPEPQRGEMHSLIACPTCGARVDETCKAQGRSDGGRPRSMPHRARLAPRLCRCGARLGQKRQLCDACRVEVNRANKRDYMRRQRRAS